LSLPLACCSAALSSPFFFPSSRPPRGPPSFPTRRPSDLTRSAALRTRPSAGSTAMIRPTHIAASWPAAVRRGSSTSMRLRGERRSEEHTSELQSRENLVCRLLLEKKKNTQQAQPTAVQRQ